MSLKSFIAPVHDKAVANANSLLINEAEKKRVTMIATMKKE